MASSVFREATAGTFCGYDSSFSLHEAKVIAALFGGVLVEAIEGRVGRSWSGNGWNQTAPVDYVDGRLRFPSCIEGRTHRVVRLVWNPESGCLGAVCWHADSKGRLLDGDRRLVRDEDGQTIRAKGGAKEFIGGKWVDAGPSDCDRVREEFTKRTAS